jgi:hypothetical protein
MNGTTTISCATARVSALAATTIALSVALTTGSARAQDAPAPQPAPSQPITIEVTRPVSLQVKQIPRVIPDWQEGEPVPAGYHPVQRVRTGAVVGGAVPFAILYFISALIAAGQEDTSRTDRSLQGLYFPVVGPFIAMTQNSSAVGNVLLAVDGLGQAGGAALVIWGLTSPRTVLVRDETGLPRYLPRPTLIGRSGAGLGWSGRF